MRTSWHTLPDLGLASAMHSEDGKQHMTVQGVMGMPGYVTPESVILGHMGFKSDVYASGVSHSSKS